MPARLAPVPSPAAPTSAPTTLAAIVASIAVWLDAFTVQYRGAGARAFARAALLAFTCPRAVNVAMNGPPGTAKTAMGTAIANAFGASFAGRTLSPWTTDADILGAVDLAALQAGRLERAHDPAHPDLLTAEVFLADEWPRSTSGIRAMFLSALADRRTPTGDVVPAHVIFAASNTRLTSEDDQAANDRFALRIDVPDLDNIDDMDAVMFRECPVENADGTVRPPLAASLPSLPSGAIGTLRAHAATVRFPYDVRSALAAFALALKQPAPDGATFPYVSPRRWVIATRLLQASAALRGSDVVDWTDIMDVLPMVYDEGETNRATVAAALTASIPTWVSALRDLDEVCIKAAERAFRVASGEPRKGEGDQHAKWRTEMRETLKAFDAYGDDVKAKASARANRARDEIDDATSRGAAVLEAREDATA